MTEHILNFSIGLDDEGIRESIKKNAEKQIINDIKTDILNQLFKSRYYSDKVVITDRSTGSIKLTKDADLSSFAQSIVEETVAGFKDEIIDKAAHILADKYTRTKKWKEVAGAVVCNQEDDLK